MSRSLFITIHLYLSSFFAAVVVLVAFSGGMYLLGIKGNTETTEVGAIGGGTALMADPSKEAVLAALSGAGVEGFDFDYVITRGDTLYTRPTSRTYYGLTVDGDAVTVTRNEPSFQKRMQELHFGHGPSLYREFQKVFAAGHGFHHPQRRVAGPVVEPPAQADPDRRGQRPAGVFRAGDELTARWLCLVNDPLAQAGCRGRCGRCLAVLLKPSVSGIPWGSR
jgi:hypothetical protein